MNDTVVWGLIWAIAMEMEKDLCVLIHQSQKNSSKYIENSVQEWLSCADWTEFNKAKSTSCGLKVKLYWWFTLDFISSFNCLEPGKLLWDLKDCGQKNVHGDSLNSLEGRQGPCETHRCL